MAVADVFIKESKSRLSAKVYQQVHSVPSLNLHVASNSSTARSVFEDLLSSTLHNDSGYASSYPVPIRPAVAVDDSVVAGLDPVFRLVKDKNRFKAMCEKVRRSKAVKNLTLEEIEELTSTAASGEEVTVGASVVELARILPLDPDPHFSANYNSYYAGNANTSEIRGLTSVVHTELDKPDLLRVVSLVDNTNLKDFEVSHVAHQMDNLPIYQIDCHSDLILLRQKKSCGLFRFGLKEELSLEKVGIVTTPDVFVSSAFNAFKQDEFATVAPNSAIEIHDAHGKTKRSVEVEGIKDNWGRVYYHDENVLMFSDRDTVSLCDLRESGADSLQWEVKSQSEECDKIFAAAKGKFLHYVGTKHYLFSLDIREGFHQRWPHGLAHSPCLLSIVPNALHEEILMGCQYSGEIVYIQNSACGDFTAEFLMPPLRLPHPRETLHAARTKDIATSPIISSRFSLSLTGLTGLGSNGKVHVFSCNAVGDLFAQSVGPRSHPDALVEQLRKSELRRLRKWETECLEFYSKQVHGFKATSIFNLVDIADMFEKESDPIEPPVAPPVTTKRPWNISKKRLLQFKDFLAPKLLAPWQIEEDDEWCNDDDEQMSLGSQSEDSSEELEDVETKIQKWLEKCLEKSSPDSTGNRESGADSRESDV